jgi:flavin-dependent dehydrogenase
MIKKILARKYDCIVVGGGPAGATSAAVLAQHGRKVLVLERSVFPRHHIGESLIPETYETLGRIGMLEKLRASDFPEKESVKFVTVGGKDSQPYFFTDRNPHERSRTWQVRRDQFDQMMLDNAREKGADIRYGVQVQRVNFEGTRAVGVRLASNGATTDVTAPVVVDATGLNALISRQLGIRKPDPCLRKGVLYGYYKGARRDEGRAEGGTIVFRTDTGNGWFWFIPLQDDVTSIGLVADLQEMFTGHGDDPKTTFLQEVKRCRSLSERLDAAELCSAIYVTMDFSYRADRVAGDGWVLVGDAFGFLDPVYSSGVMLAMKSGEMAADAIHDSLAINDVSAANLGRFGAEFAAGMERMRKLVYTFYDPSFSFGDFLKKCPEQQDNLVRILIGDIFTKEVDPLFDALSKWTSLPDAPIRA